MFEIGAFLVMWWLWTGLYNRCIDLGGHREREFFNVIILWSLEDNQNLVNSIEISRLQKERRHINNPYCVIHTQHPIFDRKKINLDC